MVRLSSELVRVIRLFVDNVEKGSIKEHFERNLEITKGKFLLTYVYYAMFYAAKVLDEDLFYSFVVKIEETPADVLPGFQLLNMIAKSKVKSLRAFGEDWF